MSSTLTMEPRIRKKNYLPYELKIILQKRNGGCISNLNMDLGDLSYVRALMDCEIPGSQELYDYLQKHDEIILDEEF